MCCPPPSYLSKINEQKWMNGLMNDQQLLTQKVRTLRFAQLVPLCYSDTSKMPGKELPWEFCCSWLGHLFTGTITSIYWCYFCYYCLHGAVSLLQIKSHNVFSVFPDRGHQQENDIRLHFFHSTSEANVSQWSVLERNSHIESHISTEQLLLSREMIVAWKNIPIKIN